MSFQWTFIAGYLYFEIAVVVVLILPIISPRKWRQLFQSRLFAVIRAQVGVYFFILLGILCLCLFDAMKEMKKYSNTSNHTQAHITMEMKGNVKMFRSQRNFYITGFAIFLTFVIKRLVSMIIIQAELLDKSERIIKEAEVAKNLARNTVLAHKMQSAGDSENVEIMRDQLITMEGLLSREQVKCKELKAEADNWKLKYAKAVLVESMEQSE